MTDHLGVILLAAADDRPFDLRPLPLGEVVRAQNYLCSLINQALKSWHEGIVYAITHNKNTYLVPVFNRCLGQFSNCMRILVLGASTQKETQLLGHPLSLLVNAWAMPRCSELAGCTDWHATELLIIDQVVNTGVLPA
jgi:hypothetical protein